MTGPALRLLVLRTAHLDRARAFYEVLGLTFVEERHGDGPAHLAATLDDGTVIELYPAVGELERGSVGDVRLGFAVDDLAAIAAALGVAPTPGRTSIVAVDPDGRRVEITSAGA